MRCGPYVILASGMRLQDERDGFGNERTSRDRRAFARLCRPGGLHYKEVRTLIVDDEPVARRVLREGLGSFPDVEIIGEAENGRDAVSQIGRLRPDLVGRVGRYHHTKDYPNFLVRNAMLNRLPAVVQAIRDETLRRRNAASRAA